MNQMGTVDLMHLWQCIFPTQNGAAATVAGRASDVIAEPPSLAATCTGPENWERANSRAEGTYHIFQCLLAQIVVFQLVSEVIRPLVHPYII